MIRPEDREAFVKQLRDRPHFRLIAEPSEHKPVRIPRTALKETLERSRIHLVGDSFPLIHWDEHSMRLDDDHIESLYHGATMDSACRLYMSGQFVHLDHIHEDEPEIHEKLKDRLDVADEVKQQLDGYLDYVWTVHRLLEYVAFVAKLASIANIDDAWRIEASLQNPGVRAISVLSFDRDVWHLYRVDKTVTVERTASAAELQSATASLCAELAVDFFSRFDFPATRENMLAIITKYVRS